LGLGTNINHTLLPVKIVASNIVSVAAAHDHSLFIKSDGSLWAMGLNDWGQVGDCTIDWPYRPEQIVSNGVVAVTAGYSGSLFLKRDGSLWGMGIRAFP
jgi:alpha-tubulin suppressor-like RCC1 family protein